MELDNLDRRELLKTVTAAAAAGFLGERPGSADAQAVKWSSGTEVPKLKAPANATDCHHHILHARRAGGHGPECPCGGGGQRHGDGRGTPAHARHGRPRHPVHSAGTSRSTPPRPRSWKSCRFSSGYQVAAPHAPLGRGLGVGPGHRARVSVGRRTHLGVGIGTGELHPRATLVHEGEHLGVERGADPVGLRDVASPDREGQAGRRGALRPAPRLGPGREGAASGARGEPRRALWLLAGDHPLTPTLHQRWPEGGPRSSS